ncbi:Signal peptide peptidase-like 2A [Trebouxia sp. C0009 RCD-2024]
MSAITGIQHSLVCVQYLLHFNASDESGNLDTVHQQISKAGAHVSSYIPDNTLLVVAQPEKLEALKRLAGVVWVGDYHAAYKASPEIQRLVGWAAVQPRLGLQQAGSKQSTQPHSPRPAKGVHAFVRQNEDGSNVLVLDVSFPQSLADGLDSSKSTIQPHLQQNVSASLTSFIIKRQPKFHPANAALADWQAPLDVVCHSQCRLAASGPGRISVTAPAEFAEDVLVWLTAQPQVHWVSPRAKTRAANFFATGIGQSGSAATLDDAKLGLDQDAGTHPFWKAGLTGVGQTVGMGDTGIDWLHCTFTDSVTPGPGAGPFLQETDTGFLYWVNAAHRKIVYYRQVIDNVDDNGHGTHCAGSAVGSTQSGYTGWQGMAPMAKIAFQDLGSGAAGTISTPDDLANGYYKGARVHSDSWGTDSAAYDALAWDVDYFTFLNQDFLPVFAAGNFGYEDVDSTLASPSVSKNCLSVGASLTASYDGTIEQEQVDSNNNAYQITVDGSLTATSPSDSTHTILLAYFGNSLASAVSSGTAYPLVAGVPADGCSPLSYPYKLPGKVVLLARGNCTYQTKVANAQTGGAVAALVYNNQEDGFEKMLPDSGWSGPVITMPSAFMPASTARPLLQDILAGATLTVTFKALTLPANRWDSLAFFSSVGPTLDGRFKPDIVTPGTTIASYSAE